MGKGYTGRESDVEAEDAYPSEVDHPPHVRGGESYDLVTHFIVISIPCKRDLVDQASGRGTPCEADVVFVGQFGPQSSVAYAEGVQIVERRHAEGLLVERAEVEVKIR